MAVPSEIFDYVCSNEDAYAYRVLGTINPAGVTILNINLTSQVWQNIPWTHRMQVFLPHDVPSPGLALIYVLDSRPIMEEDLGALLAGETGVPCVFLYDVPNQPLFGDLVEDALIARTFVNFLDTGDPTWPLLLPMVNSVVRTMDAIQDLSLKLGFSAERFLVTGASKRGWTTWLAAAADIRVAAIAPMVYDNLNLAAQLPHQVAVAGAYSDEISDYTAAGLPERMGTPDGRRLAQIIDPYTYRETLTIPKLIINGANDRYWMTDALNLYWSDLPGRKHVLYIPNAGHSLQDYGRLFGAIRAFIRLQAAGRSLPDLAGSYTREADKLAVRLDASEDTIGARCWVATGPSRDFRTASWNSTVMKLTHGAHSTRHWLAEIPVVPGECLATFGEVDLEYEGQPYHLSTPMYVSPA